MFEMYRSMGRETLLDSMKNVSEASLEALAYHESVVPRRDRSRPEGERAAAGTLA